MKFFIIFFKSDLFWLFIIKIILIIIFFKFFGSIYGGDGYFQKGISFANDNLEYSLLSNKEYSSNYKFLIVFYGYLFYIFGESILIPGIVNTILMIYALLFCKKFIVIFSKSLKLRYSFLIEKIIIFSIGLSPYAFYLNLFCLKYSILMWLIFINSLILFLGYINEKSSLLNILIILPIINTLILLIRFPVFYFSMFILLSQILIFYVCNRNYKHLLLAFIMCISFFLVFQFSGIEKSLNSSPGIVEALTNQQKVIEAKDNSIQNNYIFSENSILKKFYPNNLFERFITVPIRLIAYVLTPFPSGLKFSSPLILNKNFVLNNLDLFSDIFSTIFYILVLPFFIKSIQLLYIDNKILFIQILLHFFSLLFLISFGNLIIVGRYRALAEPLYFTLALHNLFYYKFEKEIPIFVVICIFLLFFLYYILKLEINNV